MTYVHQTITWLKEYFQLGLEVYRNVVPGCRNLKYGVLFRKKKMKLKISVWNALHSWYCY